MFCPECGFDAEEARFCPECGTNLTGVRSSLSQADDEAAPARRAPRPTARTTGAHAGSRSSGQRSGESRPDSARAGQSRQVRRASSAQTSRAPRSQISPLLIWTIVGVVAIVVIGGALLLSRPRAAASGSAAVPTAPITADTSGSYSVLVTRANALYDQGAQALQRKESAQVISAFTAAATVYRAAWSKQPGDSSVGTDYATSLFYSGDTSRALKQVDIVLAKSPDFQSGRLNKGIFLQTASQEAQQQGQSSKAASLLAQAKAELQKAVAIDPASAAGKNAAQILGGL